jgi:hypothetical protein
MLFLMSTLSAMVSCVYVRVCVLYLLYVLRVNGIAVIISDLLYVFFISDVDCSTTLSTVGLI